MQRLTIARRLTSRFERMLVIGLLVGLVSLAAFPVWGGSAGLSNRLNKVLSQPVFEGAEISALVVLEESGQVLYERQPDRALIPASNVKILTSLAVLDGFGPAHQFETRVLSDAPPDANGGVATLYVKGGGDPAVNSEDWWRLAADLRNKGLRSVSGDLVLDDTALDDVRWHPKVRGRSSRAYHAPVGALTANYGSFAVTVTPGKRVGDPLGVTLDPQVDYLILSNKGATIAAKSRRTLVVDRTAGEGGESVQIRGALRIGDKPKTYYRSVLNPTLYAGAVLRMQLTAVGIEVAGKIRVEKVPAGGHELHVHKGRPLASIVRLFMKYSNNAIAETLVKNLGALESGSQGTWRDGTPAMRRRLIELGLDPKSFDLVDGSGLSYENRATPRAMVRALNLAGRSFQIGPELISALPIGARDGTLEERASDSIDRIRAKTGLLNQVTALSGFADATFAEGGSEPAGARRRVVFSIMVNGYKGTDKEAMGGVDDFVAALVASPPEDR